LSSKKGKQTAEYYQENRRIHWDKVAQRMRKWNGLGGYYHRRLNEIYAHVIPQGSRVLELGCGDGNLLGSLKPARGLGVDLSPEMIALARERNPSIQFDVASAQEFCTDEKFDFVILSDILNEVWDVQILLEKVRERLDVGGRLLINVYSRLWELPLRIAEKANLSKPGLGENWLTVPDIRNLLYLSGFETIKSSHEILFPVGIPVLRSFFNKFLVRFWPFNHMALTNFLVARVEQNAHSHDIKPIVSVIVPARNEAGNIEVILLMIPGR